MFIDKNIVKFIVLSEESIFNALKKISDNKARIVFSINESGILEGVLTDGDVRRWLVKERVIDLNQPVSKISNKNFKFALFQDDPTKIKTEFLPQIDCIPLLDNHHRLVAIARKWLDTIQIGNFCIDHHSPTFIIAEIGNNHNGSLAMAKQLIDGAINAGANCAKFQIRNLQTLYHNQGNANDPGEDLGTQYTLDLLSRFQLSNQDLISAFDYCKERGILPLCTPWDLDSLAFLEAYGMPAYKVASADLTNHDLLRALAQTRKPLICSTGMTMENEIHESIRLMKDFGVMYILLHCNSTYPTPFRDVNLNYLEHLREIGDCPVGYSGHERGIHIAIAAVAKGAKVIEKHITLDRAMEGNDHKVSLLPDEFKTMVEGIRQVEEALGSTSERRLSQGEWMNRETLSKSLVINCDLDVGQQITREMIEVKSPGRGVQPNRKAELIGRKANRAFKAGDFFFPSDLSNDQVKPRHYHFKRPWGLPVRYHDFKSILMQSNPDLLEFHLSYKDLEQDIHHYFHEAYELSLVVHSPELFANDHLLDLCSDDESYRQHSIQELQRVVDLTRSLKPFFAKKPTPFIIVNVGGFTPEAPLLKDERSQLYSLLVKSLSSLDLNGVEIILQTMPPFPWHFGGQRYHNLFVDPEDIAHFCEKYHYRICLDVSHSKLACNQYNWSFRQFIEQVGPYIAHLHLADAQGLDGEGLQIGQGEIDFKAIAIDLQQYSPQSSFVPEIWQGHKNQGEGFWISLEKLEEWF
ncbi:MAG: N-acetylneuraminate synthase family protein [Thermosynechococcaceae cyanobacterium]